MIHIFRWLFVVSDSFSRCVFLDDINLCNIGVDLSSETYGARKIFRWVLDTPRELPWLGINSRLIRVGFILSIWIDDHDKITKHGQNAYLMAYLIDFEHFEISMPSRLSRVEIGILHVHSVCTASFALVL